MKLIVGLGNPGARYDRSRHNAGFMVLDRFAEEHGLRFNFRGSNSLLARGQLDERELLLAKPQTYMNLSGRAVKSLLMQHGIKPADLLVVYDDFDLPLGALRLRPRGSAGTHNGMRSIVQEIGTTEFPRLRVGIGAAGQATARDFVLEDFSTSSWPDFEQARDRAVETIESFVKDGPAVAMNRFNG